MQKNLGNMLLDKTDIDIKMIFKINSLLNQDNETWPYLWFSQLIFIIVVQGPDYIGTIESHSPIWRRRSNKQQFIQIKL